MSGGQAEGKGKKKKKGQTVTSRAPVTPVSEARSPPSPALRAIPRTCWCLRCSLCAGGEKKKKKKHKSGFVFLILLDKPELKRTDSLLFTAPTSDTKQGWADKNMQRPGTNKSW